MRYLYTPEPCLSLIDGYKAVFQHHVGLFEWIGCRIEINQWDEFIRHFHDLSAPSFDHWIAHCSQAPYAVQCLAENIRACPDLTLPEDGLSLLLSVACRQNQEDYTFSRLDRVQTCLLLGSEAQMESRISEEFSVWQAWCLYYVTAQLRDWREGLENDLDMSQVLEIFLQTGVDSDCEILMRLVEPESVEGSTEGSQSPESSASEGAYEVDSVSDKSFRSRPQPYEQDPDIEGEDFTQGRHKHDLAYVVSLGDFVRQIKPGNYDQLERLLGIENCTREFSPTDLGEIEAELATSQHSHFESPTVWPVDLKQFFSDNRGKKLMVYWIRWKNSTVPGEISFRIY